MSVRPAIVFIPGLLCDAALWQFQAEFLADHADVIMGDTYQDNSIAGMARRILATAPGEFALCALSMGGYVAMEIMRAAPERVTHLVLSDTSARLDNELQRQRRLDFIALAGRGKFHGVTPQLLPFLLGPSSLEHPELSKIVIGMAERLGKEVFLSQQTAIMGRIDSRPMLKDISCPAAVIVGEHDRLTPLEVAEEIASLIPHAQLHIIPQAGHLPPLESPQIFNHVLTGLLKI